MLLTNLMAHSTRLPLSVPVPPPASLPSTSGQTPNPPVSSTPMWDSDHIPSGTPAWNPSSRDPPPVRSPTPPANTIPAHSAGVMQPDCERPLFQRPSGKCFIVLILLLASILCSDSAVVPVDWLALESLREKSVLVRLTSSLQHQHKGRRKKAMVLHAGTLGHTLSKSITGDPPSINVELCIPGFKPISILLHNLIPEQPQAVTGGPLRAFVIAGDSEYLGQEVMVLHNDGDVCCVQRSHPDTSDIQFNISPGCLVACAPPKDI